MRKLYSFILVALAAMMMPVAADAQVTLGDLRGTYVFHGVANDWTGYGVVPPTVSTVTLSINEDDNSVSMTGFLGAEVIIWGDAEDGSEDIYDALHGTFDPETQQITFLDSETSNDFFTLSDDYYDWYIYNLVFQASRDEEGNVVLTMVPSENGSLAIIQTYYWDSEAGDYVFPNYGYDQGGQMVQMSINAKSYIGALAPGKYEIIYTDRDEQTGMMPAEVLDNDGVLSLSTNNSTVALDPQTSGRGANKYTYAYKTSGCYDTYYYWGEGDDDYEYAFVPQYWGHNELTLYFNADGTMSFDTGIWFGIESSGISVFDCTLAPEGTFENAAIENVAPDNTARQYFDLQGRRIQQPRGLTIVKENGKACKMLVK